MDLDFVRIECEITTEAPVQLTAALHETLRNLEPQFKASCCQAPQQPCSSCSRSVGCPYRMVFDQRLSSDPEIVRLHQKPSLPFNLYVEEKEGNGTSYRVGLVVIGSAVNYIGLFHGALLRMVGAALRTHPTSPEFLLRSYSLDYQGARHEITDAASLPGSVILLSGKHVLQNTVHSDGVRLLLKSPLRMLSDGSIAHRFDFGVFLRSQLRRCSSLYAYYGAGEMDLDFMGLSESAKNVVVLGENIKYTQPPWSKRLNRGGLTGTAECFGLIEPMFSLLLLGSHFNAGKGAAFGSGFHRLEPL